MAENQSRNPPPQAHPPPRGSKPPAPQFTTGSWTWSNPSSWPPSLKLSPVLVPILAAVLGVFFPSLLGNPSRPSLFSSQTPCQRNFNYTFQIARSKHYAETLASTPWELGTTGEALLELISPEKAVFAPNAGLRKGWWGGWGVPYSWVRMDEALVWVHGAVRLNDGPTIVEDSFSVSDPASLGVSAVMIGQHWPGWYQAAEKQKKFLLEKAPRWENGAISHRVEVPEVWADGVMMFPPFLAYVGVAEGNLTVVRESVEQVRLYREVLLVREGEGRGLWRHIVGLAESDKIDPGAWSTSNGWAAYGMLRVRATVAGWEKSRGVMGEEIAALDDYVLEILEAAMRTDDDESGLLRNYLNPTDLHPDKTRWWGETSGTTLLTAAAYRMVMFMEPSPRRTKLLQWADRKRKVLVTFVNDDGIAMPNVNPYGHNQELPSDGFSPEGEAFLLLLGAAWRDCVCAGLCQRDDGSTG